MINVRHTGIVVRDIDRSIDFYTNFLGFKVKVDMVESGSYIDNFLDLNGTIVRTVKMFLEGGGMIELLHFISHPEEVDKERRITSIGCSHIALTVKNLEKTYYTLMQSGVEFNNPPQVSADGAAKVAFCKDPDGTFLELVEELK